MPNHDRKGRSKYLPGGYIHLDGYMLDCGAWKALSPYAQMLYVALKRRHRRDTGRRKSNNGKISFSRREAAETTGFCEAAIGNAFRNLIAKGFIKIIRDSAFNMKDARAREYALTEFGVGDAVATKDFMRWTPGKNKSRVRQTSPYGSAKQSRNPIWRVIRDGKTPATGPPNTPVNATHGSAKHTTSTYQAGYETVGRER